MNSIVRIKIFGTMCDACYGKLAKDLHDMVSNYMLLELTKLDRATFGCSKCGENEKTNQQKLD